jgi:predicted transcriptional regulator
LAVQNGRKYRRDDVIIGAILDAVQSGAIRTKIMCDAYLSYDQCTQYLEMLKASGLIYPDDEQKKYWALTDKGFEALQAQRRFSELIEVPQLIPS